MATFCNYKLLLATLALLAMFAGVPGLAAQSEPANRNDMHAVVDSNNQFAIDLYRKINAQAAGKNIFVSPFSVSTALAMTFEGSSGNTRKQMANVLHLDMSDADRQTGFAALLTETSAGSGKQYKLDVANALWGQKGYHFEAPFLNATEKYYGGALKPVDFAGNTEGARLEINTWTEDHTAKMIRDLIAPRVLDKDTRLVLTNAIYFKGTWASQFKPLFTKVEPFNVSKTVKVQTPMMHQTGHFHFIKENGVSAIVLPYADDDLSMIAILPDGDIDKMSAGLTLDQINQLVVDMFSQDVEVYLPRFKMEAGYRMEDMLPAMGMPDAFSENIADFSGMTGKRGLYIGKVIHKARVEVNEEGSEAAAATAVVMEEKAMMMEKAVFRADRPFLFIIGHNKTGAILFMGRLSNPSQKAE